MVDFTWLEPLVTYSHLKRSPAFIPISERTIWMELFRGWLKQHPTCTRAQSFLLPLRGLALKRRPHAACRSLRIASHIATRQRKLRLGRKLTTNKISSCRLHCHRASRYLRRKCSNKITSSHKIMSDCAAKSQLINVIETKPKMCARACVWVCFSFLTPRNIRGRVMQVWTHNK